MAISNLSNNFSTKCFVCDKQLKNVEQKNKVTNLPVCNDCKGSKLEKTKEQEALDSLADGFVCGCI